jgi:ligand-binding sensor domain-containing protein
VRRGFRILILALAAAPWTHATVHATGAWQTYLRPATFSELIAEADTLWCVTREAGLLRFTPSTRVFTSFVREPNGLASSGLSSIVIDPSRKLWVGTLGAGASVLSADRTRWSLVNAFDGLPSDTVNTLAVSGDTVWIATTRGLAVWDGTQVSGVLPDGVNPSPFASDNITGLIVRGDTLWLATRAGVYTSLRSQGLTTWTTANAGLPSLVVDRMVTDGTTLLALVAVATYRWDPPSARWVLFGGIGAVRSLSGSRAGAFAGASTGLYRWNGAGWTLLNGALPSSANSPFVVALDEAGRTWAAGRPLTARDAGETGVYGQPAGGGPGAWSFDFPPGPPSNNLLNLDLEGGRLYLSSFGQGAGRLRAGQWTNWFQRPAGDTSSTRFFKPAYTFAMLIDKQSRKWFFTWAPIAVRANACIPDTGEIDILDDGGGVDYVRHHLLGPTADSARWSFARASTADSSGGAWFGLDSPCADQQNLVPLGLLRFRSETDGGLNYSSGAGTANLPNDLVLSLVTDRNKRVWVGTGRGLCYFPDPGSGAPAISRVLGAELYSVRGLAAYGESLWVFTSDKLYRYDIDQVTSRGSYDLPAGGPADLAVRPMDVARDGTVWLGTTNGVRVYHPSGGRVSFTDYTSANSPLADNDVRSIRVDRTTGYVWIATGRGLSRFDPGYVPATVRLPSLSISVYPNPARLSAIGVPVRLSGNGEEYVGAIYDLAGRRLSRFAVLGNGRVVWNGRNADNELARPGIYFLRAESGGRSAVVRLVLVR